MTIFISLLAAYALCFALQHKLTLFHGKNAFVDRMLTCTFCTAFHTGWMIFLLLEINQNWQFFFMPFSLSQFLGYLVLLVFKAVPFGLASSAFSYALDTFIRLAESHADPIEVEEEDVTEDE